MLMVDTQADPATWHLARGYRWAGSHCGIRTDSSRKDLAVVLSDVPAVAAGVFTRNQVRADPCDGDDRPKPGRSTA